MVEQTDIPDCNHADSGTGHTTTVVLEDVELDDHGRSVELEDIEGADSIYKNTIALENDIRSPDDSDQERSMDDHLYHRKVFLSKAELKRALSMLALKEHFEFRVKKSCHAHFEVGCKDKACKFALRATKLPEREYWQVRMLQKAFKPCIRGFNAVMRPIVAIDDTHLKGRFKGILFVAHLDIKNAIEQVYKDAHHGLSNYHLGKNVKNRFKCEDVAVIFTMAANCYRFTDFDRHMNQLKQLCKPTYDSLMRLGPERWARAWSSVRRNKLMTSNTTECINSYLRHARKMPITVLIECIRGMFQRGSKDKVVNLYTKECSYGEFQSDLLPCMHAMVAISKCKRAAIELCSDYYKTRSWAEGYAVPIRLVRHSSEWDIPDDVQQIVILPSSWRGQPTVGRRRPKTCPICRQPGHKRNRCPMRTTNSDNVIGVVPEDSVSRPGTPLEPVTIVATSR
ncbi:Uncharacterized protein TCM_002504 [Theobroma cacao]|uniref:Transposase MuDR plant domain-containing protein n=1 Tax=Theobroma cacao TaxID=3641 RepID=A0A061DMG8_THECC|nr:Uncharacterized protein TCM_002504 [Theobroma cacao]